MEDTETEKVRKKSDMSIRRNSDEKLIWWMKWNWKIGLFSDAFTLRMHVNNPIFVPFLLLAQLRRIALRWVGCLFAMHATNVKNRKSGEMEERLCWIYIIYNECCDVHTQQIMKNDLTLKQMRKKHRGKSYLFTTVRWQIKY